MDTDQPTSVELATATRESHLRLRRVERQQHLIERLAGARRRLSTAELARELSVSERTVSRDVGRLRDAGIDVDVRPGRNGGMRMPMRRPDAVHFDLAEAAAVLVGLAVLGPTVSASTGSATRKLLAAIAARPADPGSTA